MSDDEPPPEVKALFEMLIKAMTDSGKMTVKEIIPFRGKGLGTTDLPSDVLLSYAFHMRKLPEVLAFMPKLPPEILALVRMAFWAGIEYHMDYPERVVETKGDPSQKAPTPDKPPKVPRIPKDVQKHLK